MYVVIYFSFHKAGSQNEKWYFWEEGEIIVAECSAV